MGKFTSRQWLLFSATKKWLIYKHENTWRKPKCTKWKKAIWKATYSKIPSEILEKGKILETVFIKAGGKGEWIGKHKRFLGRYFCIIL